MSLCNTDGDLASCWCCGYSCDASASASAPAPWCFWLPNLEVMAMVPIMRLTTTKKTAGVNQLFMDAQIEAVGDIDSSNMASTKMLDRQNCREKNRRAVECVALIISGVGVKKGRIREFLFSRLGPLC